MYLCHLKAILSCQLAKTPGVETILIENGTRFHEITLHCVIAYINVTQTLNFFVTINTTYHSNKLQSCHILLNDVSFESTVF